MSISLCLSKEIITELDRVAKAENLDQATVLRQIILGGLSTRKLKLAIRFHQDGMTLEQAADKARVDLWDLLDELDLSLIHI